MSSSYCVLASAHTWPAKWLSPLDIHLFSRELFDPLTLIKETMSVKYMMFRNPVTSEGSTVIRLLKCLQTLWIQDPAAPLHSAALDKEGKSPWTRGRFEWQLPILTDRKCQQLKEICYEKLEKFRSAPAFVKMQRQHEKKSHDKTLCCSFVLLSVSETRPPCLNLHRATCFSLTGESEDRMNTHRLIHIYTHTHTHTLLVRTPQRPAVCWGADEGIARIKTKCVSMHINVFVCERDPFPLRESLLGFPYWELTFLSLACHFTDRAMTLLSKHTHTHTPLILNGCTKVFTHKCMLIHTNAHTCTHTLSLQLLVGQPLKGGPNLHSGRNTMHISRCMQPN